jgi:hypothetical protein
MPFFLVRPNTQGFWLPYTRRKASRPSIVSLRALWPSIQALHLHRRLVLSHETVSLGYFALRGKLCWNVVVTASRYHTFEN